MPAPNYQTVKLARGRHVSPEAGVCVMELASMLAGEPFTDRPRSVSPAIAGFLRSYNDLVDDDRRQDLYACAAEVLDTRGDPELERERSARLQAWGQELRAARWWRRMLPEALRVQRRLGRLKPHQAGPFAVHSISRLSDELHASVLNLVRELVEMRPVVPAAAPRALATADAATDRRIAGQSASLAQG